MVPNHQPGARCYQSVAVIGMNSTAQHRSTAYPHPSTKLRQGAISLRDFGWRGVALTFHPNAIGVGLLHVDGICVSSMIAHELSMGNGQINRISIINTDLQHPTGL